MDAEEMRKRVCDAWRIAANALSVRIEAPFTLKTKDAEEVLTMAHLPDFGGPRGMIIGLLSRPAYTTDKGVKSAAESLGLYYSLINPEVYERYDEEVFKEALADWGFFGNEDRRPKWLQKPTTSG
jgi:hypothetical protein